MEHNLVSRLIKGFMSTGVGTFFEIALGFISLLIAIRFISAEDFGIFVLIQLISMLLVILSNLLLENITITKFIADADDRQKGQIVNTAISCKLILSVFFTAAILLAKPLVSVLLKTNELTYMIVYIAMFYLLSNFYDVFQRMLQGFHLYNKMAFAQIINSLLKVCLVVVFLVVLKMGLIGLIYAFLISFAVSILFQYIFIPVKKHFALNKDIFSKMFKFGFPLGLNSILTFIFTKVDSFMIAAMISPLGVAYYDVASKIPDNMRRMYIAFQSVFFPNMSELYSKKKYKEAEAVLNNSLRLVSFGIIFAAFLILLFHKEIIRLVFSERYMKGAPALPLLMLTLGIGLVGNIMGMSLIALGQSDKPVKINFFNAVTNVLGNMIMIPIFGFMGAVYATLLSRSVTNPLIVYFLKRSNLKINFYNYVKPILIFITCSAIFLVFRIDTLLVKFSFIFLFLLLSIASSQIRKKDLTFIFNGFTELIVTKKALKQVERL